MSSKKTRTVNVPIYTKSQYEKDERQFEDFIKDGKIDFSVFHRLMTRDLCVHSSVMDSGCIGDVSLKDVELALKYPKQGWKILLAASDELMRISPHYFRMNSLYSNMALFCWGIDLYDVKENAKVESVKKQYSSLASKLENMNLKHEYSKIMKFIPYQDIYCG